MRAALALVAAATAVVAACASRAVDGPVFQAPSPRAAPTVPPARLTIVSYNVHLGRSPERIAAALRAGGLADADLYLIQEIEDHGPREARPRAEDLAAALGLAVVYTPARALGGKHAGSHGLAVLSRWPIVDHAIVKLPYFELPWSPRPRIALGVLVDVAGTPVQVWNVHLDTRLAVESRLTQARPVFERARSLPGLAIVGGDFNTWARHHEQAVDTLAASEGFATPTAQVTDTVARRWLPLRLDALYTRGFAVVGAGVDREVRGSDHVPLWVQVAWPRDPGAPPVSDE